MQTRNRIIAYILTVVFCSYISCSTNKKLHSIQEAIKPIKYPAILDSLTYYGTYPSPFRNIMRVHKVKEVRIVPDSVLTHPWYIGSIKHDYEINKFDKYGNTTYIKKLSHGQDFEEYYQSTPTGFIQGQYIINDKGKIGGTFEFIYIYDEENTLLHSYCYLPPPAYDYKPHEVLIRDTINHSYSYSNYQNIIIKQFYQGQIYYKAETDSAGKILKVNHGQDKYSFHYNRNQQLDSITRSYNQSTYVLTNGLITYRKVYDKGKCVIVYKYTYIHYIE